MDSKSLEKMEQLKPEPEPGPNVNMDLLHQRFKGEDKSGVVFCDNCDRDSQWFYLKENKSSGPIFSSFFDHFFREVFLPRGYPESVHSDYAQYQIWDTVQAFASTILGTLTTHSIMRGVGVGESTATPLAAAISWILKDGTGMVGRIVFAWWSGPELDAQCKKWRLVADVVNDLAMGIELTLPYFPSSTTTLLCFSSAMKSLVGVAGGATRASITQHQAIKNNLADVSAKDGSQETCVNLIASLIGVFMLSSFNAGSYVFSWYIVLALIHIYANYRAVRSLRFETLNEDRLAIIVKHYLLESEILTPKQVNERESLMIFHRPSKELCGFDIVIGESLKPFINSTEDLQNPEIVDIFNIFHDTISYDNPRMSLNLLFPDLKNRVIRMAPFREASSQDIIKSYCCAFMTACYLSMLHKYRMDLVEEAETYGELLLRLYKMVQEARTWGSKLKALDKWIYIHSCYFLKELEESEWTTETNLLPIGPFKSYEDMFYVRGGKFDASHEK